MIIRTPQYYNQFKCIASECRDNCCCGGWLIELDEDTVSYYRSLQSEYGKKLCDSLMADDDGDICFKLVGGRCPHLDENGLCSVLGEIGEEHMGVVCREFPRYSFSFGNVGEKGIGLACEEAVRIILADDSTFSLTEDILPENEDKCKDTGGFEEEEEALIDMLLTARDEIFTILADRQESIADRTAKALEFAEALQNRINRGELKRCTRQFDVKEGFELLTDIFANLEALDNRWTDITAQIRSSLFDGVTKEGFKEKLQAAKGPGYDIFFEKLMSYFVFRYFMKAVKDYNPLDKIRFAVCSCLFIWEMLAAAGICLKKPLPGENKNIISDAAVDDDIISLVKTFSRQVEYSEENVEAVCEEFLFGDDFAVDRLTAMVLV